MILQKKAFVILPAPLLSSCFEHNNMHHKNDNPAIVQEIDECDIGHYKMRSNMRHCPVLVVHELACGPDQKKNVLPVSYWFGLVEGPDLVKVAYPQAKRIVDEIKSRNKAGIHAHDIYIDADAGDAPASAFKLSADGAAYGEHCLPRSLPLLFSAAAPFFELRSRDGAAFDHITDTMKHRRAMLTPPLWRNIIQGRSESGGHDLMHRLQSHGRTIWLSKRKSFAWHLLLIRGIGMHGGPGPARRDTH
jgi:hypothetical protein